MKARIDLVALLTACAVLAGCAGTSVGVTGDCNQNVSGAVTVPLATNIDLTVTGTGNTNSGEWAAGVSITFKEMPPEFVLMDLAKAGAVRLRADELVWVIAKADPKDPLVQKAIGSAVLGGKGVTIKGYK